MHAKTGFVHIHTYEYIKVTNDSKMRVVHNSNPSWVLQFDFEDEDLIKIWRRWLREGLKKCDFNHFGVWPPTPPESDKTIFYFFWILDQFSKFIKNEVKVVKVAVSATMRDMSAAPQDLSPTTRDMLAKQDKHGNSRGLEGLSGGGYYIWKIFMV